MGKAACEAPAGKLALYDKLLATNPRVELKGAASAYTSLNGHMFTFMTKTGTRRRQEDGGAEEEELGAGGSDP